jgi:hypothetical protein
MTALGVLFIVVGIALTVVGSLRFARLLRRANELEAQEANLRRYESWRGRRPGADRGPTSAELMSRELRRRAFAWLALDAVGAALIIAGMLLV